MFPPNSVLPALFVVLFHASGPTAISSAPGPQRQSDRATRVEAARGHYNAQRWGEAAAEFEGLASDASDPAYLKGAAASRFAAGHYAHAAYHLERMLALPGLSPEDRTWATGILAEAKRKTVSAQVRVSLSSQARRKNISLPALKLVAMPETSYKSDNRPALVWTTALVGAAQERRITLDREPWTLAVDHPAFEPVRMSLDLTTQSAGRPVELQLKPRKRRGSTMAASWGVAGGTLLVAGLSVGAYGAVSFGEIQGRGDDRCGRSESALAMELEGLSEPEEAQRRRAESMRFEGCYCELKDAVTLRSAGFGLLGAGVGGIIGGLTALQTDPRRRKIAWGVELGLGAAATLGGVVGVSINSLKNVDYRPYDPLSWQEHYVPAFRKESAAQTGSAMALGIGAGLVVSSAIGLIVDYARERRLRGTAASKPRKQISWIPSISGLVVQGRF